MPASIKKSRLNAFINQAGLCYYCKSAMWLNDVEAFATKYSISTSEAARFQCTPSILLRVVMEVVTDKTILLQHAFSVTINATTRKSHGHLPNTKNTYENELQKGNDTPQNCYTWFLSQLQQNILCKSLFSN